MRYLSYQARSSAEVRNDLLRHGAGNVVTDTTLEKLRGLNYIDDQEFARNWAVTKAQQRGYGPEKITYELTAKGVAPWQIDAAIKEILALENEAERARKVLQKRFKSEDMREPHTLRRAAAFLQRRGYSNKVISSLLESFSDNNC